MGPMTAANMFLEEILSNNWPKPAHSTITHLTVSLHGSLAFTGIGHATDRAVILGLMGENPATVNPDEMDKLVQSVYVTKNVHPKGHPAYQFDPEKDLIVDRHTPLSGHPNGLVFEGRDKLKNVLLRRIYYSIGGGFVVRQEDINRVRHTAKSGRCKVPFPFENAANMLDMAEQSGLTIAQMKRANEETIITTNEIDRRLDEIFLTMKSCVERGLKKDGELPGGLHIKRRAKKLYEKLLADSKQNLLIPSAANDWLAVYAIAVNEENAAGGRVVTAPTNGAAGVIPAVLSYYMRFCADADQNGVRNFLLTAAAVGGIIKYNASISGAEVGCQGEVGSASSMAAAGLTAALGGTPKQIENAAEIALEHHLGMTCDPVAGLVQVPCIERNAMGAVKAVTAASLALHGDGSHFVSLDACIKTMRETGRDMSERYKETSKGGLAVNVTDC